MSAGASPMGLLGHKAAIGWFAAALVIGVTGATYSLLSRGNDHRIYTGQGSGAAVPSAPATPHPTAGSGSGGPASNNPSTQVLGEVVTRAPKADLVLSGSVAGLVLGRPGSLPVKVENLTGQDLRLQTITVTPQQPDKVGCLVSWLVVTGYHHTNDGVVVGKKSSVVVSLAVELRDLPVEQNPCLGATFPLVMTGTATKVKK